MKDDFIKFHLDAEAAVRHNISQTFLQEAKALPSFPCTAGLAVACGGTFFALGGQRGEMGESV